MNSQIAIGKESPPQDLAVSESRSAASWVAGKIVVINEMIPGQMRSDDAARLYLKLMIKIASEVGQERFSAAIEKAIETQEYRRPTIATMRRLCGLLAYEPTDVALAWDLVTRVVTRHTRYNENGTIVLTPRTKMVNGKPVTEQIPQIPADVMRTVNLLGGWAGLLESHPTFWGQKYSQFKDLFWQDEK